MDILSSGTLLTRTKVCGRPNCRCATDENARHGPYYEWNRKVDGRLVHRILNKKQAELVEQAIANYREVQRLLLLWERETVDEIAQLKNAKNHRNHRK